ncbi:Hypothetical protein SRAE_2000499910 [Strongyloides ratti]|uniref:Uncharacterized protein n=1 Tax=Strongyloides ratti TaxID=34506 RepID=A0A090MFT3_STRRB|nr:Hypothetical protein SRAE_2000499910 [Strongyloides ratti]CEG06147.1 Hypothetical protein SRAE_2000499910 [Strongyloides ratti]
MKYLIPLYFILFISIITIINVNSAKKAPKKPTTSNVKSYWTPLKVPLNGSMVTILGKKGVIYYNKEHNNSKFKYINVTEGETCGQKVRGNKKIRLTILVAQTLKKKNNKSNASCNHLRAVFNVTKEGRKDIILVKLLKTTVTGICDINDKDKELQKTTKKPTKKSTKSKSSKGKKN